MVGWIEVAADIILGTLYIFLLIRLSTSSDSYFSTPFYTFFITTGIYSIVSVMSYHIVAQPQYSEPYWTVYIFKAAFGVNLSAAIGATIGKAYIAIHRYHVIRTKEFTEKKLSTSLMHRLLASQFVVCLVLSAPVWPASYVYQNNVIIALDPFATLIIKIIAVVTYILYILCNGLMTVLTSRELLRLKQMLMAEIGTNFGHLVQEDTATTQSIIRQQRHMFIIVLVCSLSHLIKTMQQFTIAIATFFELTELYALIWPMYPLANGLATYAAPVCLVRVSKRVRKRLLFTNSVSDSSAASAT